MIESHPDIETPPDNTVIWRYIDIERFLSILTTKNLYLCRLDNFRDPWEGSWPSSILDGMKGHWPSKMPQTFIEVSEIMRKSYFVNCWHESSTESAALWDLYARNSGVAIRSTIGLLKESIKDSKACYIGRVKYVNFETELSADVNFLIPPFLKRKSFEHEKEVRVLNWSPSKNKANNDTSLEIEPNILIEKLFISPACPEWLVPALEGLCGKFGLITTVKKSSLYDERVY